MIARTTTTNQLPPISNSKACFKAEGRDAASIYFHNSKILVLHINNSSDLPFLLPLSQFPRSPFQPSNMKLTKLAPVLLLLRSSTWAWGGLGHETVAYIATNFVAPSTKSFFQEILSNTTNDYLASVATWADSFRYTSAGRFSAPFHFIDAQDSPPGSCGVKYSRDCGVKGCVGAIQNYVSLRFGERRREGGWDRD